MRWPVHVLVTTASLLAQSGVAFAKAPIHRAEWVVAGEDRAEAQVGRDKDGNFLVAKLRPARLFLTKSDAVMMFRGAPRVMVSAGTYMVPIVREERRICTMRTSFGSAFACLIDEDGDGRYDTYSGTQVFNEIFLNSIGDDGERIPLVSPITVQPQDPKAIALEVAIGIKVRGVKDRTVAFEQCILPQWKMRFDWPKSCSRRTEHATLDGENRFALYEHSIGLNGYQSTPPFLSVRYSHSDVPFLATWTFP